MPSAVRRVEIAKPDGGVRLLGIPTVLDRFLQQAIAQALTPLFEAIFSVHSYGFRPGRSAHDAVKQAQEYVREGYDWVVDIDLEQFFDRVNHDMLMARVGRVMASVGQFVEQKLKLKVNRRKSKVDRVQRVKFLGFSFYKRKGEVLIRVARKVLERCRERIRRLTKRTRSGKLEQVIQEVNTYLMGWIGYFRQANTPSVFKELDEWVRRRLRQLVWKRWKWGTTRYRELVALGVSRGRAALGEQ